MYLIIVHVRLFIFEFYSPLCALLDTVRLLKFDNLYKDKNINYFDGGIKKKFHIRLFNTVRLLDTLEYGKMHVNYSCHNWHKLTNTTLDINGLRVNQNYVTVCSNIILFIS